MSNYSGKGEFYLHPVRSELVQDDSGNIVGDKALTAQTWRDFNGKLFTNGVISTSGEMNENDLALKVVTGNGIQVLVNTGSATALGGQILTQKTEQIILDLEDSTDVDRTDLIVLRIDYENERDAYIYAKSNYQGEALERTNTVHEFGLASVLIPANSTDIVQEDITDLRSDTGICGWSYDILARNTVEPIVADHEDRLNAIEPVVASHTTEIANINTKLDSHDASINTLNSTVSNHETRIATNEASIVNHETRITTNESNIETLETNLSSHTTNISNPHAVTKTQVGLGNVDNTSDLNKPISSATQIALDTKANLIHNHLANDITDLQPLLDLKQDKTDQNLNTNDKTVVGSINEVKANFEAKDLLLEDAIGIVNNKVNSLPLNASLKSIKTSTVGIPTTLTAIDLFNTKQTIVNYRPESLDYKGSAEPHIVVMKTIGDYVIDFSIEAIHSNSTNTVITVEAWIDGLLHETVTRTLTGANNAVIGLTGFFSYSKIDDTTPTEMYLKISASQANTNSLKAMVNINLHGSNADTSFVDTDHVTGVNLNNPAYNDATATFIINDLQTNLDRKLDESDYTADDVLNKIKTVDGAGSGLDADLHGGQALNMFDYSKVAYNPTGGILVNFGTYLTGQAHRFGVEIRALTNQGNAPVHTKLQFYRDTINNTFSFPQQLNLGYELGACKSMFVDGVMCVWIPVTLQYNAFYIGVVDNGLSATDEITLTASTEPVTLPREEARKLKVEPREVTNKVVFPVTNTFKDTGGEIKGMLTIPNGTIVKGTGTGDAGGTSISFYESDLTTRRGYIGQGGTEQFKIVSEQGDVLIEAREAGKTLKFKGSDNIVHPIWHAGNLLPATPTANGLMSASDKAKLDSLSLKTVNDLINIVISLQSEIAEFKTKINN